jgi:hypothetical protein|tara:strand:+ start:1017 stop:1235 length:219 start_codon:yes stop_codon:yes gene_type:complete
MDTFIELCRRFLIVGNWIFFSILSIVLIGGSLNVNSRMFYFALGVIAFAFINHYLINYMALIIRPKKQGKKI